MPMPLPAILALVLLVAVLAALPWTARYNRARLGQARLAMEGAVASRGWRLLSARLCWVPRGPFALAIACHVPVYRVVAQDPAGHVHRGWVRCQPFHDAAESAWEGP